MFAYCNNNPVNASDPTGHSSSTDADGNGIPDYLDNRWGNLTQAVKEWQKEQGYIDPNNVPNPESGYVAPKKNPNPRRKVPSPNGVYGWPAQDGGVWVPDNNMDGGPGWVVQYPGGSHEHHYPDGKVRTHDCSTSFTRPWYLTAWNGIVTAGSVIVICFLTVDNVAGGAPDDIYIEPIWDYIAALWE